MEAGYYKLIDREGYLSSHPLNEEVLQVYGDVLHVDICGNAIRKRGPYQSALILLRNELQFFEYLGTMLPKPVQEKRTPKAGEVWSVFTYHGEEVFYTILEVDLNGIRYDCTRPERNIRIINQRRSLKTFMSKVTDYRGIPQYRTFSH